ncbi:two-component system histidine kinase PnpS [Niallia sp. 01092]|uniref:two-component system histidine kinase PnpS n=1 Tax=unclassified Niallia TaxID=2837522 RepID=UPI003FD4797D
MRKFKSKLLSSLLLLVFIVFLLIGLILGQLNKKSYLQSYDQRMKRESMFLANEIENAGGIDSVKASTIKEYSELLDLQITITDKKGTILFDEGQMEESLHGAHIKAIESIIRKGRTNMEVGGNADFHYYSNVLSFKNQKQGYLFLSIKLQDIQYAYHQINGIVIVSLVVAFALLSLIGFKLIYRYMRPVESATKVASELANGNYHARTYEDRVDGTGVLSSSINTLAKNFQDMVKAQEIQQDRLGTLIESIGSGLLLIDSRGYINLINKAYKDLFSVHSSDYLYKLYYKVLDHREITDLVEEIFMTEQKVVRELVLQVNEDNRNFQVYGVPIIGANDVWMGILLVFHEITELKKLEQIRKDFVANVSHELKTPITSIKGFSETLLDGAMENKETLVEFLRIILKESDRMQQLIQDLLDLTKLEQHGFSLIRERLNILDILDEAIKILWKKAETKELELIFKQKEESIWIEGDRGRLTQVFLNLISNAISYTPNGGKITVSVLERRKDVIVFVEDTGIGIENSEITRIFERFYRVDKARSRNSGGTGLGLAIVKHLIELHKGTIKVESKIGKGTTFQVQLKKELPYL